MLHRALAVVIVLSACGGDDDDGDDGGSTVDAGGGGLADAAAADAATPGLDAGVLPDAAADPDAGSLPDGGGSADAAPTGMVIDSIRFDGEFTQVRQGSGVDVVVAGSGLAGVTAVVLGEDFQVYPETLVVSDVEVAFTMWVSDRAAPGPTALTLIAGEESATASFPVTPWVVAVDGGPDGRGTYESPMSLCDERLARASRGARVELLAGEHECTYVSIGPVSEVVGQGVDVSIVRTIAFSVDGEPESSVTVRDLRVVGDVSSPGDVSLGPGSITLRDVATEGLGVAIDGVGRLTTMERVVIEGRAAGDCVLVERSAGLSMTDVGLSGCSRGVVIADGGLTMSAVTITGCEIGVLLGGFPTAPNQPSTPSAFLSDVALIDNQVGLLQASGASSLIDVAIHGASVGPVPSDVGIQVGHGTLGATGLTVDGVRHGVDAYTGSSDRVDGHVGLTVEASLIEGGEVGLDANGGIGGASIWLVGSVVSGQTEAAVRIDGYWDSFFYVVDDELSVESGHALDDVRAEGWVGGETVLATGTTLNGNAYDDQLIRGPVEIGADLRIAADNAWVQF